MTSIASDAFEISVPQWPIDHISNRISSNITDFKTAKALDGGWEVWSQVEIAFELELYSSHYRTTQREQYVFSETGRKIDLWLKTRYPDEIETMGIELKCRKKTESSNLFQKRMRDDIMKITRNRGPRLEFQPAWMLAVGITDDNLDLKVWDNDLGQFYYHEVKKGGITFYIIWWESRWRNSKMTLAR
ncbi:hypothetical protein TWF730_010231 [Orbilia blumenaviensis]|uniref:Uncharacterized protein n=1 Tax=Orbilia blumenaviensis TaxID=1796055 RepID=A0AAV9US88_9PEZI